MSTVYPQVGQVAFLNLLLEKNDPFEGPLILRLFSNDRSPGLTDVAADYTEVVGGGYIQEELAGALFTVTADNPSLALYADFHSWVFTGAPDSPGTVYGAYIVDQNEILIAAHRFIAPPYNPIAASIIKVRPRITLASS